MTTAAATLDLDSLKLLRGEHATREEGVCLLEAVAWFAGREHTDRPRCVSPVLGAFGRAWNDALDDARRQQLIPYIPRFVGTAGDGKDETRAWLATDWLCRVCAPAWLRLIALHDVAYALERCAPILSAGTARAAQPTLDRARREAGEAMYAARAVATAVAWETARAAAWETAKAAGRNAAEDAAWTAARDAAWATATAAAVARDAATDAARDAARVAAWAVATEALVPTRDALIESAFGLLDRMLTR